MQSHPQPAHPPKSPSPLDRALRTWLLMFLGALLVAVPIVERAFAPWAATIITWGLGGPIVLGAGLYGLRTGRRKRRERSTHSHPSSSLENTARQEPVEITETFPQPNDSQNLPKTNDQ